MVFVACSILRHGNRPLLHCAADCGTHVSCTQVPSVLDPERAVTVSLDTSICSTLGAAGAVVCYRGMPSDYADPHGLDGRGNHHRQYICGCRHGHPPIVSSLPTVQDL